MNKTEANVCATARNVSIKFKLNSLNLAVLAVDEVVPFQLTHQPLEE